MCVLSLLRPYSMNILTFKSKKCIFISYSSNHRGSCRCLVPVSNKVYSSCHVVFDEHSFPSLSKTTNTKINFHAPATMNTPLIPFTSINSSPFNNDAEPIQKSNLLYWMTSPSTTIPSNLVATISNAQGVM